MLFWYLCVSTHALATFHKCMMSIFYDFIGESLEVFIDDFSIFGPSFDTCLFGPKIDNWDLLLRLYVML